MHGGSLQDVFKSIKYGWKDKGMPEWGHNMSPKQIAGLASFIKSMSGKNVPGGKAPQGEPYAEREGGSKAADSSKATDTKLTANKEENTGQRG